MRKLQAPPLNPQWIHEHALTGVKNQSGKGHERKLWVLAPRLSSPSAGMDLPSVSLLAHKKSLGEQSGEE